MHDSPFDPQLMDLLVARSKPGTSIYLGSKIYAEILKPGFGEMD
jgi:hypothetical protein